MTAANEYFDRTFTMIEQAYAAGSPSDALRRVLPNFDVAGT